jgi:serine/threonine protein kinase
MEGGDLLRRVHPYNCLKEADMQLIFFQLAQAIKYLHQKSIVHRDIKVIKCYKETALKLTFEVPYGAVMMNIRNLMLTESAFIFCN